MSIFHAGTGASAAWAVSAEATVSRFAGRNAECRLALGDAVTHAFVDINASESEGLSAVVQCWARVGRREATTNPYTRGDREVSPGSLVSASVV